MPKHEAVTTAAHDPVALIADLHYRAPEIAGSHPAVAEIVRSAALDIESSLSQRGSNDASASIMPRLQFARDS